MKKIFQLISVCALGVSTQALAEPIINFSIDKEGFTIEALHEGRPLSDIDLNILNPSEPLKHASTMKLHALNSALDFVETIDVDLTNNKNGITSIKFTEDINNHITGKCEAYYLTYHVKGDDFPKVKAIIRDSKGAFVPSLKDDKCKKPSIQEKESIIQNNKGVISGFFWTTPVLRTDKPVSFNATYQKEGAYYLPALSSSYAIKDDLSQLIEMRNNYPKNNSLLLAFTGINYQADIIQPGLYYFFNTTQDAEGEVSMKTVKRVAKN